MIDPNLPAKVNNSLSVVQRDTVPRWLALNRGDLTVMAEKFERENHRPRQWLTMLGGVASLALGAALIALGDAFGWPSALAPVFLVAGWAGTLTCFGIAIRRERKLRADYGIACPSCNAPLVRNGRTELVVATGNCPSCGEKVFDD